MTKSEAQAAVDTALTGLEDACARYLEAQKTADVTEEDCLLAVGHAAEALARAERALREAATAALSAQIDAIVPGSLLDKGSGD